MKSIKYSIEKYLSSHNNSKKNLKVTTIPPSPEPNTPTAHSTKHIQSKRTLRRLMKDLTLPPTIKKGSFVIHSTREQPNSKLKQLSKIARKRSLTKKYKTLRPRIRNYFSNSTFFQQLPTKESTSLVLNFIILLQEIEIALEAWTIAPIPKISKPKNTSHF